MAARTTAETLNLFDPLGFGAIARQALDNSPAALLLKAAAGSHNPGAALLQETERLAALQLSQIQAAIQETLTIAIENSRSGDPQTLLGTPGEIARAAAEHLLKASIAWSGQVQQINSILLDYVNGQASALRELTGALVPNNRL